MTATPVEPPIPAGGSHAAEPVFDLEKFRVNAEEWSARHAPNKPFPHIVLDDMLRVGPEFADEHFPKPDRSDWRRLVEEPPGAAEAGRRGRPLSPPPPRATQKGR
jgi:hypothetical protein